jgi:hypothetical protein
MIKVDPNAIYQTLSDQVSKFVGLALVGLVTTGIGGLVKWLQDHSRNRRGTELTARISALAKMISELPEVPLSSNSPAFTPRSALTAELESAVHELTALQAGAKAGRRFTGFSFAAIIARLRDLFLLYRPKGWVARTLHLAFYVYLAGYLFCIGAVLDTSRTNHAAVQKSASGQATQTSQAPAGNSANGAPIPDVPAELNTVPDLFAFVFIFGLLAIPPAVMRHYAARIHRRKCEQAKAAMPTGAANSETTRVATPQEAI